MERPNQTPESGEPLALQIFLAIGIAGILVFLGLGIWAGVTVRRMNRARPDLAAAAEAARSDDPAAVRDYAWSLFNAGNTVASIDVARRAVELEPANAESHLVLGAALQSAGRLDEGEASLEDAMRLDPENAWVHYYLAGGYSGRYAWEETEAHARRAIELDPTIARAHALLAMALRYRFEYEEAEAAVQEGLRLNPEDPSIYGVLGEVLKNTARPGEAIRAYTRAAELDPRNPTPWLEIGVLEHIRGNYAEAVTSLERAQALDPQYFAQRYFEQGVLQASREGHAYQR